MCSDRVGFNFHVMYGVTTRARNKEIKPNTLLQRMFLLNTQSMPSQTVHFVSVSVKVIIANCRRDNCPSAKIFATREWHGETGAVSGGGAGPAPRARAGLP